jgi:uncharacterized protein
VADRGVIDCDVHCAPATMEELAPHLPEYWQRYVESAGVRLTGLPNAYPAASARPTPSSYDVLKRDYLAAADPHRAILNCLTVWEIYRNPYFQAEIARAVNDWLRTEWLDRDERLWASIVVPNSDPDAAVAEIERVGDDRRFVQVLLPARTESPYGNKRYHRIYDAAAERDLAIGLHAWGYGRAPTPTGFTHSYLEDYLLNASVVQRHVLSLVAEGVFDRLPGLRVALIECGFAWLPPLLWRFDKAWKSVWHEVPWVREKPSAYVARHFKATTAPAHVPVNSPEQVGELLEIVGPDWLMHASDYPHAHGASSAAIFDALDDHACEAILAGNAAAFYRGAVGFAPSSEPGGTLAASAATAASSAATTGSASAAGRPAASDANPAAALPRARPPASAVESQL